MRTDHIERLNKCSEAFALIVDHVTAIHKEQVIELEEMRQRIGRFGAATTVQTTPPEVMGHISTLTGVLRSFKPEVVSGADEETEEKGAAA